MNSGKASPTGSLNSTSSLVTGMKNVEVNETYSRDQRRMLEHLKRKFNIPEMDANTQVQAFFGRRRNRARKTKVQQARNPTETEPAARAESARAPGKTESNTSAERAVAASSAPRASKRPSTKKAESANPKMISRRPEMSLASALKCRRVGIIGDRALSVEDLDNIKLAIISILRKHESEVPPEFHSLECRLGFLVATVADVESVLWLKTFELDIAKEVGFTVRIVNEEEIPSSILFRGYFHKGANCTNEELLRDIGVMVRKDAMNIEKWKVVRRIQVDPAAIIFISVDEVSADHIASRNGVIPFLLGHVRLERIWSGKPTEPGEETAMETAPTITTETTEPEVTPLLPPQRPETEPRGQVNKQETIPAMLRKSRRNNPPDGRN